MWKILLATLCLVLFTGCVKTQNSAEARQSADSSTTQNNNNDEQLESKNWSFDNTKELHSGFPIIADDVSKIPVYEYCPCDKGYQAKSWDEVTIAERMLAIGYEKLDPNGDSFSPPMKVRPMQTIASVLKSYYLKNGAIPETSQELYDWYLNRNRKWYEEGHTGGKFDTYKDFAASFLESVTSPVTGKLIEWNHQNFSRGNAFVTIVNANPTALENHISLWKGSLENHHIDGARTNEEGLSNTVFVYYRAYGESGVLVEKINLSQYTDMSSSAHT